MKAIVKLCAFISAIAGLMASVPAQAQVVEDYAFTGEVQFFPYNECPTDWVRADGRLMPISGHDRLFRLLGTNFGGDARTNFGLPDLRGRSPMGVGNDPDIGDVRLGETFEAAQIPLVQPKEHRHQLAFSTNGVSTGAAAQAGDGMLNVSNLFNGSAPGYDAPKLGQAIMPTKPGAAFGQALPPTLPFLACIVVDGVTPPRP